jgi:hypothetical protein
LEVVLDRLWQSRLQIRENSEINEIWAQTDARMKANSLNLTVQQGGFTVGVREKN